MNELITITTDGQGSSVVSARELHTFLEVRTRFNDWIKGRIIKYGFQQDVDFVEIEGFTEISVKPMNDESEEVLPKSEKNSGGRPQMDYALTLDMAKQLSMVENNQKGKEARRYFINAERKARQLPAPAPVALPSPTEQLMLTLMQQQAQLMAGQQAMLEQLRADVDTIRQNGNRPPARPRFAVRRTPALPHQTTPDALRQQIVRKVNQYCDRHEVEHTEAYRYLYKRLSTDFGFNVYNYRAEGEKLLDAVDRYGYLIALLSIVDSELAYRDE